MKAMISITALILAGGRAKRMNHQDKGLMPFFDRTLIEAVIDKIAPQVDSILINANRHFDDYARFGFPVVCDQLSGFLGPLAGIHAGLLASKTDWNLIVSCDTPNLPEDLCLKFIEVSQFKDPVFAKTQQQAHPIIQFIHRDKASAIAHFLNQGQYKPLLFLESIGAKAVNFGDREAEFVNLNTKFELRQYEHQIKGIE